MMAMAINVKDIFFCDEGDNDCVRCNGDGDGSDRHCYRIEDVMHVIDVMAMMMDTLYTIEAVMHEINVMAMMIYIVIGLKL